MARDDEPRGHRVYVYQRALGRRRPEATERNADEDEMGDVPKEASVKVKRS
jgi:hypothetical protein